MQLILKGLASNKTWTIEFDKSQLNLTVLELLVLNSIPIASSCSGVGKCKKCTTSDGLLSCQILIKDYIGKDISFSYL